MPISPQQYMRVREDALVHGMASLLADAIGKSSKQLPNVIQTLGQALQLRKMPRKRMRDVNIEIAEAAQAAVVRGWYSRLPRKTWLGGPNRLSGHLGRALADPYNTAYTTDRVISFINTDLLDQAAPHWYRVNYGASGSRYGQGRQARRFIMQLNGQQLAAFSDDLRPDPISWIPVRRYYDSDGNMFPRSHEVERSPFGARPARFFELGHSVVAKKTGQAYETLWRTYLNEQGGKARQRLQKTSIRVEGDLRLTRNTWRARVR